MKSNQKLNLAIKKLQENKFEESLEIFSTLINGNANDLNLLKYHIFCLIKLSRFEDAIVYLSKAIKIENNNIELLNNLAFCYQKVHNFLKAEQNYLKIIKIDSKNINAYLNLGSMFNQLNQFDKTVALYDKLMVIDIDIPHSIYTNLSSSHIGLKNLIKAEEYAKKAFSIEDKDYKALINLSIIAIKKKNYALATKYLEIANSISPNDPLILLNFGILNKDQENLEKALYYFDLSIKYNNQNFRSYLYKGLVHLALNNFEQGWKNYEYRWFIQKKRVLCELPLWKSASNYKKILIWGEQGLGEQILFTTILNDILSIFDSITLLIDKKLKNILKEIYPTIEVLSFDDHWSQDNFDCQLPIASLGYYFRNNISSFIKKNNYEYKQVHKIKLNHKKVSCGISWKSINSVESDSKSMKLSNLKTLIEKFKDKVDFYDIQYTDELEEINQFYNDTGIKIIQIDGLDKYNDLTSLSELIKKFDFVISISNTTAHLSALLGIKTYVMLSKNIGKLWYWSNNLDSQNLWYPSAKIFRQKEQGEWQAPILDLTNEIANNLKT